MEMVVVASIGAISALIGFVIGWQIGQRSPVLDTTDLAEVKELATIRWEIAVIARVLEEAGIKFHRDYHRNITGVVHDAEVLLTGEGAMD